MSTLFIEFCKKYLQIVALLLQSGQEVNDMNDDFLKEFGQRALQRRLELGLSQLDVAKRLGYKTRQAYSLIENGERGLTQSKCVALARALDTSVAYLMGVQDDEVPIGIAIEEQKIVSDINALLPLLSDEKQELVLNLVQSLVEAKQ